ncbi:MAG: sigma 54-interacting transcriptional regulator [Desulfamplus sp.]|nr:sigma 54-interacting transcriptional regulator [Desulfamplus sp.]
MNYKLKLCFNDRMGIVADISTILADSGFNIVSMEVDRKSNSKTKNSEAHVYTEIEDIEHKLDQNKLIHLFDTINNFLEIEFIDILPQEEKANRFKAVLDNMSDGVVSVDRNGIVTTINKVAADAFMCNSEDIIGKSVKILNMPQYEILNCLKGYKIDNVKQNLITSKGRYQYISTCKPIRDSSDKIIGAVEIAKEMQEIKKLAESLSIEADSINFSDIIGKSQIIKDAIAFAQKIAPTDITVSLYGPSGTGKELFAKAIHNASRSTGAYIPVNCAAFPEQLLESELFGYVGGSFTGGKKEGKIGLFEAASNGTIFLDEIAEMNLASQAKLLRLIQEKAVRRIGDSKEIPINTRIVTATNKNLEQLVKENRFREDLYYRINVIPINVPPLKQRKEDIPILVEHFLFQLFIRLGKKISFLTPSALEKLNSYNWPGNVRELKSVVERAAFLSSTNDSQGNLGINTDSILFNHELNSYHKSIENIVNNNPNNISIDDKSSSPNGKLDINRESYPYSSSLKEQVAEFEKKMIIDILKLKKTIRKTASELKISHPALLKKMQKYDIRIDKIVTTGNS